MHVQLHRLHLVHDRTLNSWPRPSQTVPTMTMYGTEITDWGPKMRAKLKLVKPTPTPVNGTVPPKRVCNADMRPREYLTPKEVERLIKASRARGRYGARDGLAILMAYRHGLRAGELAGLRWDQVEFNHGLLHVRRLKNGMPSVHPLSGEELRALRALRREDNASRFVFMTERGSPMSAAGFRGADRQGGRVPVRRAPAHAQARLWVQARQ
jgi:type 1 fimbriae regulatory protein FimB/type 1 fimbriae regulatory protein FimE